MRIPLTLTILAAAAVLGSCRTDSAHITTPDVLRPGQGIISGALEVSVDKASKKITLRNTTEFVVGYLAVERDLMTVALFPPCGDNCTKVVQAQSKTIDFTDVVGYTPEAREARILWWTYARGNDGVLRPQGAMQTTTISLD